MKLAWIALLLAGALCYGYVPVNLAADAHSQTVSGNDLKIGLEREKGVLEVRFKGRKLLVYAFALNQFKPYVRELHTLRGDNVLRDAPADHLHHHGLMCALRVNGVNFWEEVGQPGHKRSVKLLSHSTGKNSARLPRATFAQLIHWIADQTAGTTRFFTTLNPFAYLSETQGLDKAPLQDKAGDKFGVVYLMLVYPSAKSKDFLERRYRAWTTATAFGSGASEALRR